MRWNIENVEREKTSLARNLYPVKLHFKTEREIKSFSDQKKKNNTQFDASRPCFERNIKGVLKRRKITYIRNTIIQKEKMSTGERIVKKINLFILNWLYKKQFNIIIATVYLIMYLVCIHIYIYVWLFINETVVMIQDRRKELGISYYYKILPLSWNSKALYKSGHGSVVNAYCKC